MSSKRDACILQADPPSSRSVIYNWANATSHYIKSLDPNHMVTMGDEGFGPLAGGDGSYPFTTAAGGYDWQTDLDIPTLDFGTLHLYPDSCKRDAARWPASFPSYAGA
jgi:endo-1,4-beta-mannosidase